MKENDNEDTHGLSLPRPEKIISDGEAGVGIGALVGAERCCISTGGYAPSDYKTENGSQPILQSRFGLIAHPSANDLTRTRENIAMSDAVVLFLTQADNTKSELTIETCNDLQKPWRILYLGTNNISEIFRAFIRSTNSKVLNVSGSRESVSPGIAKQVANILVQTFNSQKI
ncbi:YpsA SLOG family protein [Microbulbifer epialgicus]|uniref:YpsA SLOG family protein n=1 Tax=Microbulbifer epialgicus TaxID=393907 RepID=A0ABV4NTU2_9GAMM